MKTLLVAINAKFIHTSLAVRYLKNFCENKINADISFCEFTINHRSDYILEEIFRQKPDILAFSSYIWNIELILDICESYKKVAPKAIIILGGPEVSYTPHEVMADCPFIDYVISGEGEEPFCRLIEGLGLGEDISHIGGLTYNNSNDIITNRTTRTISMDELIFPYPDLDKLDNRIFYYESSRGCPFNCQYCLSSTEKGVRFKSLRLVFADLKLFINANVGQVKFVDRTFNCNKAHALAIWRFLSDNDNGVTNFHFEITAELLDDETLMFLSTVRKGLFQFEIGVQSTNLKTLEAIDRKTDPEKLFSVVQKIEGFGNIHQHLDLIAGLPFEGISSFEKSFNDVFAVRPQQLQLGFLKVLKGSGLYRDKEKYGLVYRSSAPYEVLCTPDLSFDDALKLKYVEEMTEIYYNSCRFCAMLKVMLQNYGSSFDFFLRLGEYFKANNYHAAAHAKEHYYTVLKDFYLLENPSLSLVPKELILACRFDIMSHEKPRKIPGWADDTLTQNYRDKILAFLLSEDNLKAYLPEYLGLDPKFIVKILHIEVFDYDKPAMVIFDYKQRDILGRARIITLDVE